MNAKTILKLLATQDYDELKRLALAELSEKSAKTATEKTRMRAIVQLSKQAAKNKMRPGIAGAYERDGALCITDGYRGIVTSLGAPGCVFATSDGRGTVDLKCVIRDNCPPAGMFEKIDPAAVARIKSFFDAAKAAGDKRKKLIKISGAFFDFTFFDSIFKCFVDPVFAVAENSMHPLIFKDEASEGIVLPVWIEPDDFDASAIYAIDYDDCPDPDVEGSR